jgi:hypothetical protein
MLQGRWSDTATITYIMTDAGSGALGKCRNGSLVVSLFFGRKMHLQLDPGTSGLLYLRH